MKRRLLVCVFCLMLLLTGCDEQDIVDVGDSMIEIDGEEGLFYRIDTGVVYIIMTQTKYPNSKSARGYGYMAPYISKNGKFCIYNDNEIQEIQ